MEKESNNHCQLVLTCSFPSVLKSREAPVSRIWFAFVSPHSAKSFGFTKENPQKSGLFPTQMVLHLLSNYAEEWKPLILYLQVCVPTSL